MMTITFYYSDGTSDKGRISDTNNYTSVECGILRGEYSIALNDPENFKKHFVVGYKLENDKGEMVDSHIYRKEK